MNDYKEKTIKQFDEWSATYEEGIWGLYFSKSNKVIYRFLKKNLKENSAILDIGCGTGGLLNLISSHFKGNLVGLDISEEMLKIAKKKNLGEKIDYIHGDIEDADLTGKVFDAVVCMNSFHHYLDHKNVVRKIFKHLKNGGIFILLDPINDNYLRKVWVFLLNNIFGEKGVKYFSKKDLNNMIKDEGLVVLSQKPFMYFALLSVFKKEG